MNKRVFLSIAVLLLIAAAACQEVNPEITNPDGGDINKPATESSFAKGADISWVTQMEDDGYKFYNSQGRQRECTALMKELGMNAIRLRVWVDPADGRNNRDDVLLKALRAKNNGMRLMIDFHYSDTWADPANQSKPKAWTSYSLAELRDAVADHTVDVLSLLKQYGVEVEWVQVGNETRDGMLWDTGRCSTGGSAYAELTNAGYDAVKSVYPDAKVIVHIDNGHEIDLYTYIFDYMRENGGKYDVIGMSLYPDYNESNDWRSMAEACIANIKTLADRYSTEVMICEVGMKWDNPEKSYEFLSYLINNGRENTNGKCLGVFYWEPQAVPGYNGGYTLGAFDLSGRPTSALDAFNE